MQQKQSYLPVPVRLEVCGLLAALSVTFNVPVLVPVCVGLNVTLILRLDLAAKLGAQVVVETLKSPVVEIARLPVSATVCLLASVNTFAGLVVPTVRARYVALAGVNVAATMPVPVSGTICGLPGALSAIVTSPVSAPSCVGLKTTLMMHVFPAASVLPQGLVLVSRANSPLGAMLAMFSVEPPVFLSVTFFAELVVFSTTLPNARDAGVKVTAGPPVTVRLSVVVFVNAPDTPLTVTVTVPVVAVAVAAKVRVLVVEAGLVTVAGFGLKVAVTPVGRPEAERVTLPLKQPDGVMVTVVVPLLPCATVIMIGLAESVRFGVHVGQLFVSL